MDAGLAVRDYICASTAALVDATPILGIPYLYMQTRMEMPTYQIHMNTDLTNAEEASGADLPKFTVAVLPRTGRVLLTHLESRMPLDKFDRVKDLAVRGAGEIGAGRWERVFRHGGERRTRGAVTRNW